MKSQVGFTNSANFKCIEDLQKDYVDLYLTYCGMENCKPSFGFGPAIRTEYILHIVTSGKGKLVINKKTYQISKNSAFLISPDVISYYEADSTDPWSYIWVGFNGLKAYECITNAGFSLTNPITPIYSEDILSECISNILESHQLTYANELKRTSELLKFFSILIEDYTKHNPEHINYDYQSSVYIKYATNYLYKNYANKIKISDLANYIGVHRSYLTHTFKKVLNTSPQDFLIKIRIDKAISLLNNTRLPIKSISMKVGYPDPLAFSKIFKKIHGVSPKTFRNQTTNLIITYNKEDYLQNYIKD